MSIGIKGVGGVFIRAQNPEKLQKWYEENLGLNFEFSGVSVFSRKNSSEASLVFALFDRESDYFGSREKEFMINFWVSDLDAAVKKLREKNCNVPDEIQTTPQGRFSWVTDPEGNKIELWEPAEDHFKK
ncbi:MAG: VOC family protein [Candidatus Wallbacteria bacterium]|nr:VOC family protein [Candidatus Wallbacteria bacterium]